MQLRVRPSDPWWMHGFAAALRADPTVDLTRATWCLAAHRSTLVTSELDVELGSADLDRLASKVADGLGATVEDRWHRLLFVDLALSGNGIDYHDVRNSFLPDVLVRRVGIPISIAVLGIELGRRVGLDVRGIGMPGHFLLGVGSDWGDTMRYLDPFHSGALLDHDGVRARFDAMFGDSQPFQDSYLDAVSSEAILVRMLANLKQNYARQRDLPGLRDVLRLRSLLPEVSITEVRELLRLHAVLGDTDSALDVADDAAAQLAFESPAALPLLEAERDRLTAGLN